MTDQAGAVSRLIVRVQIPDGLGHSQPQPTGTPGRRKRDGLRLDRVRVPTSGYQWLEPQRKQLFENGVDGARVAVRRRLACTAAARDFDARY